MRSERAGQRAGGYNHKRSMRPPVIESFEPFNLQPLPGTYVLVCYARKAKLVRAGRMGRLAVGRGYYFYVGSALGPGGLRARLAHHMRPALKPHWHIDYLRTVAALRQIWFCYGEERREHFWASVLHNVPGGAVPFPGFGSSDCGCESHLYFFGKRLKRSDFYSALYESDSLHPPIHYFDPE